MPSAESDSPNALRFPLTLMLRSSRRLNQMLVAGAIVALLMPLLVPDRWGALAAVILVLLGFALGKWNARQAGTTFTVLSDGTWQPPGCGTPKLLAPSSVDLGGILWLHGYGDDGSPRALMVLPDACESQQLRRALRVWFHHVAKSAETEKPETV